MRSATIIILLTAVGAMSASETIVIDAAQVLRRAETSPVGINVDYLADAEARRPEGTRRTLSQWLGESGIRWLRYPGGEKSDNHLWTVAADGSLMTPGAAAPAPLRPRLADPATWPGGSELCHGDGFFTEPVLDFDAFVAICRERGCEPLVVVPYDLAREIVGGDTAPTLAELQASAAAWVRYANVEKGYGVRWWTIGNESWFRKELKPEAYVAHVRAFAIAMRAVDPEIRIVAQGNSAAWFAAIAEASDVIDALDVHEYPVWQWTAGYRHYRDGRNPVPGQVREALRVLDERGIDMPVMVTETNIIDWGVQYGKGGWRNVNDHGHALVLFDLLGQFLLEPRVLCFQVWNTRYVWNVPRRAPSTGNRIADPGFEAPATAWTLSGTAQVAPTAGREGGAGLVIGPAGGQGMAAQEVALQPGMQGTLTVWAKVSGKERWSGAGIDYLDADGTKIGSSSVGFAQPHWTRYDLRFAVPAEAASARLWIWAPGEGIETVVDDCMLDDRLEPEVYDLLDPTNEALPTGMALAIWGRFLGDRMLSATGSDGVRAWATRAGDDGVVTVFLLNRREQEVQVGLRIENAALPERAQRWIFRGSSPEDPRPTFAGAPEVALAQPLALALEPLSITVLRFGE